MTSPDPIDPGFVPLGGIDPLSSVESGESVEKKTAPAEGGSSSIEKSKSVQIPDFLLLMDIPILSPPTAEGDAISLADSVTNILQKAGFDTFSNQDLSLSIQALLRFQAMQHEVGDKILEQWVENLKEIDDEIRKVLQSFAYQQIQEEKDPVKRAEENEKTLAIAAVSSHTGRVLQAVHEASSVDPTGAALAVGGLALVAIPAATGLFGIESSVTHVAEATMTQAANQMVPMIPSNMAAELGLIGALLMTPLLYQTSWNGGVGAIGEKGAMDPLIQAQAFAREVLQLGLKEGFLGNYMHALVETLPVEVTKGQPLSRAEMLAMVRLLLGVIAFGWLNAAEQGTKQASLVQLAAILRGEMPVPEDDPLKSSLFTMIHAQMALISKGHLAHVIEGILAYLENASLPKKAFRPSEILRDAIRNLRRYRYESYEG